MRIAILNGLARKVGGVETYLESVVPALAAAGHEMASWFEDAGPADRPLLTFTAGFPTWCAADDGIEGSLAALARWRPDVLYAHGLNSPTLEARLLALAPAVLFAHNYYGTCISGQKAHRFPTARPCNRRFGPACLLHYFPRRCGGLNPLTMLRLYRQQANRLQLLRRYRTVLVASEHMREEYLRHGLSPRQVVTLAVIPGESLDGAMRSGEPLANRLSLEVLPPGGNDCWNLLFLGRMEANKGGHLLMQALPLAAEALARRLSLTLGGDGSQRRRWEGLAAGLRHPGVQVRFRGWLSRAETGELLTDTDLLVIPGYWPEPFGLVGVEAGQFGVPVAAFDVGGIRDWLVDGVNGTLAPGNPPTARGLAEAIASCLRDPVRHGRLRRGARELTARFGLSRHLDALLPVLAEAAAQRRGSW